MERYIIASLWDKSLRSAAREYLRQQCSGVSSDVTDVIVSKIRQVLQEGFEIQMLFLDESEQVFLAVNALLGGFCRNSR